MTELDIKSMEVYDFSLLKRKLRSCRISHTALAEYISDVNGFNYKVSKSTVQYILSNKHLPDAQGRKSFHALTLYTVKQAAERLLNKALEPFAKKETPKEKEYEHEAISI